MKEGVGVPYGGRKKIAKKLCPIAYSHCPNPLAILCKKRYKAKKLEDI
jgi:hypothetical protein